MKAEHLIHVSKIARLNLTSAEIREFLPQLNEILESFSLISTLDTDKVEPSYQPLKYDSVLRADETGKCLTQESALKNSFNNKEGYIKGPKVL